MKKLNLSKIKFRWLLVAHTCKTLAIWEAEIRKISGLGTT
jgi:hypothetical protein